MISVWEPAVDRSASLADHRLPAGMQTLNEHCSMFVMPLVIMGFYLCFLVFNCHSEGDPLDPVGPIS